MATLYLTHPSGLEHATPAGHPERPDRLRAIERALAHDEFKPLLRAEAPPIDLDTIALVHPREYVESLEAAVPAHGLARIDADTAISSGSWEPILRAAGGGVHAVDEVVKGKAKNAFVAMRPPGHHAETTTPMGFCFINNAAIAARYAQKKHGVGRVAIVDFDVHHGNGSQEIFWADPTVMYCSTHEMPLYPGTGAASERGEHDNIVNVPLAAGNGGPEFRAAVEREILPDLDRFKPEFIIVSAGFDAHARDPLANLNLLENDYAWVTERLMEVADKHANGRLVSTLEGGYDLLGLANSVAFHVRTLMRA